jgi:hypothetical protein
MAVDDPTEGALGVTDAFLDSFNACDAPGHADTLAYPHVRLASGTVRIWQDRDEAVPAMERAMAALRERAGWSHSTWDHRRVIHARGDKVHLDVQFTRHRADGAVIGVYPAIYVVVREDDRWLIAARSSFAP